MNLDYLMDSAKLQAFYSKDPSTKVGAVIARPDGTVISVGRNGFPKGMNDTHKHYEDRSYKYPNIIHAEVNAVIHAKTCLLGCTIAIWPLPPCEACMSVLMQAGIYTVVIPVSHDKDNWTETCDRALEKANEYGIQIVRHESRSGLRFLG